MAGSYDLIIIGGGHNALVTAAYVARSGVKVLVLERGPHGTIADEDPGVQSGQECRLTRSSHHTIVT